MKLQKAKKDHICTLCGKKINKGDKYFRCFTDINGCISDRKEHTNCEKELKL